ncbi:MULTISPECIES: helix-turn-helix transcriptional regulator [unclassified Chryseobacterium]|uniref:helix-turn-helix transcriptional regulator n=1 Tax=unclassified Chryseobacterium TaxID=2593645 RepID=UPI001AE15A31|nr:MULTISPECIES: helix-turn-helix transcriptional regulator [unclassified Chryseobacterium]MBP1165613.1 DNA-binding CsgD family transcriptional regulator [Chryseobacterium sp. PvR013]MDR4894453.1 helix-turn-helix transcriptional regulator [Chryseobacterium sp. CFS7]
MFVFGVHLSTIIYVLILLILIVIAATNLLIKLNQKDKAYYIRFLLLLIAGLIYNIVEELFPDKNSPLDLITQYIISYTSGLASAIYFVFYLIREYEVTLVRRVDLFMLGAIIFFIFICSFIIPLTLTKSINISRYIFLSIVLIILLVNIISILKNQYLKFKSNKEIFSKVHSINGAVGFISIVLFVFTILASSGNQFIVQTFYTLGFFIVSIDYFLYPIRKKEIKKSIPFEKLSVREAEVLMILLENPNLKYPEISQRLNISEKTLSTHLSNIYKKTEIKGKKEIQEMSKVYKYSST